MTPVTAETFAIWKKTRLDAKTAQEQAVNKLKSAANSNGKTTGMSGRDLVRVFCGLRRKVRPR